MNVRFWRRLAKNFEEGVQYVPSDEHELARLEIWREVACPLLDD